MKHPNAAAFPDPFVGGAMTELEAHYQYLKKRLGLLAERWGNKSAIFQETVRHIVQIENRRKRYPRMKEPARITKLRTKYARL